ncbi:MULTISPECIES: MFS transporter [Nocardioides]|uniref:MFS transporter n=1 Tax=Nocardioides vastitatis TaxID=2568655 RepID=A0ABW0ZN06_9ACTN|nr:MFS transporter [Nocardioides sp.]THJ08451.1 MFS transporter [Nocardioides sp.]
MLPLAAVMCAGFSGYAVLLTVAPLWAVDGGATTAGSGLVNGVLLLFTVLTQLLVPRALRRLGWEPVLTIGLVLLGVPGVLLSLSDGLGVVLALSAVRGVGFGLLTVTGSAAVAALVSAERRGEAIGAYGLAVAVPYLVLLPAGPWIAESLGYWVAFALSALPLAGIPAALRLASALRLSAPDLHPGTTTSADPRDPESVAYRRLLRPMLLLLAVTFAGGAVITFTPQMVDSPSVAAGGLLLMGLSAALSRWRIGVCADRYGAQRFLVPLVPLTGVGMALVSWSVANSDGVRVGSFLVAMVLIGLCSGGLQNLTLLISFTAVSRRHNNLASAVWNVGFDAGTALGSVAVGVIAELTSFATAFLFAGAIAVATLPLALQRAGPPPRHRPQRFPGPPERSGLLTVMNAAPAARSRSTISTEPNPAEPD